MSPTPAQRRILEALAGGMGLRERAHIGGSCTRWLDGGSDGDLTVRGDTFCALVSNGLVAASKEWRGVTTYELTPAGRAALASASPSAEGRAM